MIGNLSAYQEQDIDKESECFAFGDDGCSLDKNTKDIHKEKLFLQLFHLLWVGVEGCEQTLKNLKLGARNVEGGS